MRTNQTAQNVGFLVWMRLQNGTSFGKIKKIKRQEIYTKRDESVIFKVEVLLFINDQILQMHYVIERPRPSHTHTQEA